LDVSHSQSGDEFQTVLFVLVGVMVELAILLANRLWQKQSELDVFSAVNWMWPKGNALWPRVSFKHEASSFIFDLSQFVGRL